jgi:phosphoglycolate phosphatase-like HAD superfamily hydrolase
MHVARRPSTSATASPAPPADVLFLDLDGVLVDSAGELSSSAYDAALARWPAIMEKGPPREAVLAGLAAGRPAIIAGYEALAMTRLMAEAGPEAGAERVLSGDWPGSTLASLLSDWGEDPADLASFFEAHRTAAAADEDAWLARNAAYPGVVAALRETAMPWYVVSSKSGPRVALLARGILGQASDGFGVGGPRVRAGLQPPDEAKPAAIVELAERVWGGPTPGPTTLHFVDDRFDTLRAVAACPALKGAVAARALRLWHAGWGYATEAERRAARADPAVTPLTLDAFCEFLRWGLVMGVDDGCEPSAEEVEAGVK